MDLYKTLGIEKNASQDEIKKAHRKLVKEFHPDKETGDEEKFKEVQFAYDILSSEEKRERYDTTGETKSEDSFQHQFLGFLSAVVIPKIEQREDIEADFDLCAEIKKELAQEIKNAEEKKRQLALHAKKLKNSISRVKVKEGKENMLQLLLEARAKKYEDALLKIDKEIEFNQKCEDEFDNYEYLFTEKVDKPRTWLDISFEQSSFSQINHRPNGRGGKGGPPRFVFWDDKEDGENTDETKDGESSVSGK